MPLDLKLYFIPALIPRHPARFRDTGYNVVVIDILRASTTIVALLTSGAESIQIVKSVKEARQLKKLGFIVAGERDGKKLSFADYGNSFLDFRPEQIYGKKLVFTSTNGTQAILKGQQLGQVVVGSFHNLSILAEWLIRQGKPVILLCAGWKNTFCLEDTVYGGALASRLQQSGKFQIDDDVVLAAMDLWALAEPDPVEYLSKSTHFNRLQQTGEKVSLTDYLIMDTSSTIPYLHRNELISIHPFINPPS